MHSLRITVHRLRQGVRRLLQRNDGQDLLEYGLLMALIAVGAIFSVTTLGNTVNTVLWQVIANNF